VIRKNLEKNDPLVGTRLGDYTIRALIGRGGMARVYEGVDERLGRRAAIKVMEVHHERQDEMTMRFVREARAVANLDHPNIISIYQFGEGPDLYYMAMKYVEGRTLLSILKQMRQDKKYIHSDHVLTIVTEVASALDYAHSHGVIHRDIKPSNIMLTTDNHAVLTDFGLTMQLGTDSTLGTAFGTPRYIAPEQAISSQRSVPQSDIYSLGVVLYEMATGQAPFDSDSPMSLALSHITSTPPPPQSLRPDLPHPVQMVILKALEKRPENRWQTGQAMASALHDAYQGIEPNIVLTQEQLEVPPSLQGMGMASPGLADADQTAIVPAAALPNGLPRRRRLPGWVLNRRVLALALLVVLVLGAAAALNQVVTPPGGQIRLPSTPVVAPRIRLIYSKDTFAIYNATGQVASLEGVSFVRDDPSSLPIEAAIFGDRAHRALPAGQCLRLKMSYADDRAWPQVCGPQTIAKIWVDSKAIFWAMRSDDDPVTTFLVKRSGQVLQTCSTRLNTCEFSLP
jgi:tRNA A-37 threonylcarbamoyl transferase component Bud32